MSFERTHKVKTWESVFLAIRSGEKKAEFRRNDRDFAVGDIVIHKRYRPEYDQTAVGDGGRYLDAKGVEANSVFTIDTIKTRITHITTGFGIPEGFCMFSFEILPLQDLLKALGAVVPPSDFIPPQPPHIPAGWVSSSNPSYPSGYYYEHTSARWGHSVKPAWVGYSQRTKRWLCSSPTGTDGADSMLEAMEMAVPTKAGG